MLRECQHPDCDKPGVYTLLHDGKRFAFCASHHAQARQKLSGTEDLGDRIASLFGEKFRSASFESYVTDPDTLRSIGEKVGASPSRKVIASRQNAKEKLESFTRRVASKKEGTALLFGPEGTGKTHLVAAATRQLMEAGLTASVWHATQLVTRIRATYNQSPAREQQSVSDLINQMLSRDVLVLEDIRESCFARDIRDYIFDIVDAVYRGEGILLITSNYTIEELRDSDRLGPHLVSRLHEPPSCIQHLKGFSYRAARKAHQVRHSS